MNNMTGILDDKWNWNESFLDDIVGQTIVSIETVYHDCDDIIFITTKEGNFYKLGHYQQCCENVELVDQVGELQDITNSPILVAEKRSGDICNEDNEDYYGLHRYNFYEFRTNKGYLTLRFEGHSNGYYGVEVDFMKYDGGVGFNV